MQKELETKEVGEYLVQIDRLVHDSQIVEKALVAQARQKTAKVKAALVKVGRLEKAARKKES